MTPHDRAAERMQRPERGFGAAFDGTIRHKIEQEETYQMEEPTIMFTAREATEARKMQYSLKEVYDFIRRCAPEGNRAVFSGKRIPNSILRQLQADGYTLREIEDGWEVRWPEPQELEASNA